MLGAGPDLLDLNHGLRQSCLSADVGQASKQRCDLLQTQPHTSRAPKDHVIC